MNKEKFLKIGDTISNVKVKNGIVYKGIVHGLNNIKLFPIGRLESRKTWFLYSETVKDENINTVKYIGNDEDTGQHIYSNRSMYSKLDEFNLLPEHVKNTILNKYLNAFEDVSIPVDEDITDKYYCDICDEYHDVFHDCIESRH